MKLLLCLFATFLVALAERETYTGYNIWEVAVNGPHQAAALHAMEEAGKLEILKMFRNASTAEVWMGPEGMASVAPSLRGLGMAMRLPSDPNKLNLPARMAAQFKRLDERFAKDNYAFDVDDFNRYSDWMTKLDNWKSSCPTGLQCTVSSIGNSYEGRAIKKIVIKKSGSTNKKIYLEHTIHAREWLSTTTIGKFIEHIITDYSTDTEVKNLVNNYDLHIIPIANPDGYEYTWTSNRMWRKNRGYNAGSSYVGTDLNRNFNAHWSKQGTSTFPGAEIYHGDSAASEAETKVIQNEVQANKATIKAWFAVHCCYDVWMFPYGFNENYSTLYPCAKTDNHDNLKAAGNAAINAINSGWKTGTICDVIYAATGDTANYAYDKGGIKYTFAIELNGDFIVDKSEIPNAYNDFWKGFIASVNKMGSLS